MNSELLYPDLNRVTVFLVVAVSSSTVEEAIMASKGPVLLRAHLFLIGPLDKKIEKITN